jgi:hypothetical protein
MFRAWLPLAARQWEGRVGQGVLTVACRELTPRAAILIASNTQIVNTGRIQSFGGNPSSSGYNGGAGGAIRLVAPAIGGAGVLDVTGRNGGGYGRIRLDTLDRTTMSFSVNPPAGASVGAAMVRFPKPGAAVGHHPGSRHCHPRGQYSTCWVSASARFAFCARPIPCISEAYGVTRTPPRRWVST